MSRVRSLTVGLIVLAGSASFPADLQQTLEAAEAAYAQKNFNEALKLYDEALLEDPSLGVALFRSGEMKSWGVGVAKGTPRDFKGAIARFDQLLAKDASDRFAALAKARTLVWAGDSERAAQVAIGVLKYHPDNQEAHLMLGDILLAGKRYPEARSRFQAVLSQNARDSEALVGMARTYHYAFEHDRSRVWYRRALVVNPQDRDANFGIAWSEFYSDPEGALRRANDLARRFPADGRSRSLRQATRNARSAIFSLGAGHISDSAANKNTGTQADVAMPFGSHAELFMSAFRYSMESAPSPGRTLDASATSFSSALAYGTGHGQKITVRGAVDLRKDPLGESQSKAAGGASLQWGLGRPLGGRVSFDHDNFRYTPESIAAEINTNKVEVSVGARVSGNLFADVSASHSDLVSRAGSADRNSFAATTRYRYKIMDFGYGFEHSRFNRDLGISGFFTPTKMESHRLEFRIAARFREKVSLFLSARGGTQSWTAGSPSRLTRLDGDRFVAGSFNLTYRLSKMTTLEFTGNRDESGVGETAGFRTNSLAVRLRVSTRSPW